MALVILRHPIHLLIDLVGRRISWRYLDADGVTQNASRKLADVIRVRRGEQQILTLCRQKLHNTANIADKSHIEHAVRLVEHEALDRTQVDLALLRQVQQSAGRGDEQVAAVVERINLRIDADTTKHNNGTQPDVLAVRPRAFGHLCGQLASWSENESPRRAAAGRTQLLQQRQYESRGFTRARLSTNEHNATRKNSQNGLGLNGSRNAVAFFQYSTQQLGLQPEIGK